jgi:hypothetical protein
MIARHCSEILRAQGYNTPAVGQSLVHGATVHRGTDPEALLDLDMAQHGPAGLPLPL